MIYQHCQNATGSDGFLIAKLYSSSSLSLDGTSTSDSESEVSSSVLSGNTTAWSFRGLGLQPSIETAVLNWYVTAQVSHVL